MAVDNRTRGSGGVARRRARCGGLGFFRRSVELAEKHKRPDQRVLHTVQTRNGTLRRTTNGRPSSRRSGYLVGLSIDGPARSTTPYRVKQKNEGSFDNVVSRPFAARGARRRRERSFARSTRRGRRSTRSTSTASFATSSAPAISSYVFRIVERATARTIDLANRGWGGLRGRDRPLYRQAGNLVTDRTVKAERFGRFGLIAIFGRVGATRDVGTVYRHHLRHRARELARPA